MSYLREPNRIKKQEGKKKNFNSMLFFNKIENRPDLFNAAGWKEFILSRKNVLPIKIYSLFINITRI